MNDDPTTNLFADEEIRQQRPGYFLVTLTVLALATAVFGLWRSHSLTERLDELTARLAELDTERDTLLAQIQTLSEREAQSASEARKHVETLLSLSRDVAALETTTAELQDRSALPQRSWARAEALALLELAGRQLRIERNVDAAIEAMTTADARLAQLREPVLNTVRRQLTAELETLRAFPRPDLAGITERLRRAEVIADTLPVRGVVIGEALGSHSTVPMLDGNAFSRAWAVAREAAAGLITVRRLEPATPGLLTAQERALRQQRLQLLFLGARVAALRGDQTAFATALAESRAWLGDNFDDTDARVAELTRDLAQLADLDIAPPLPDVSGSLRLLQQLTPLTRAPS